MTGAIDPTKPADGVPTVKADLRSHLPLAIPAGHAVNLRALITQAGGATWFGFPGEKDFS